MSNIYKNPQDNTKAAERGQNAEALFELAARAAGWAVTPAPPIQDYECHVDFTITWVGLPEVGPAGMVRDGAQFTVDVKAHNPLYGDDHWLEIRNVQGNAGWLYGEADYIAFQREKGFLMVDRVKLRDWVNENVAKEYVTVKRDALMKVYTRSGRKDMITKVHGYHLIGLADGRIPHG
jgi:hypothetical protein